MPEEKITFEEALKDLEHIVKQLEQDELPLEKALEAFEKGVKLSKYCSKCLDDAEKRIEQLTMGKDGEAKFQPWDEDNEGL